MTTPKFSAFSAVVDAPPLLRFPVLGHSRITYTVLLLLGLAIFVCATPTKVFAQQDSDVQLPYEMNVLSLRYLIRDSANPVNWDQTRRPRFPISRVRYDDMLAHIDTSEQLLIETMQEGSKSIRGSGRQSLAYNIINSYTYNEFPPNGRDSSGQQGTGPWFPNYREILEQKAAESLGVGDICSYIDDNGIKEIWLWSDHDDVTVPVESQMASRSGGENLSISNDFGQVDLPRCGHTYILYHFNFTRAVEEATHNHLHQIENMLGYHPYFNRSNRVVDRDLFDWEGFGNDPFNSLGHRINPGSWATACGDSHWLPTSIRNPGVPGNPLEYDYANRSGTATNARLNKCSNWNPQGTGASELVSCNNWDCEEIKYYIWWMQRLPGDANGLFYNDGRPVRNWWTVVADFDSVVNETSILLGRDEPIAASLSVGEVTMNEDVGVGEIPVTLSQPLSTSVTVGVHTRALRTLASATGGQDYYGFTQRLTFAPGETTAIATVTILDDVEPEGLERFGVRLFDANGADIDQQTADVFITDNDAFGRPLFNILETAPFVEGSRRLAVAQVTLSTPLTQRTSVRVHTRSLSATAGQDYYGFTRTLTFEPGQTRRYAVVIVLDDEFKEGIETMMLRLFDPVGAGISRNKAIITILDDD